MSEDFRVLITGTRHEGPPSWTWTVCDALLKAWAAHGTSDTIVIVHGACPTGIDRFAGVVAGVIGCSEESHPADWAHLGKRAGPLRNQAMVDLGADLCIAFPRGESRGTRDCMRRAEAAGIPVEVHEIKDGAPHAEALDPPETVQSLRVERVEARYELARLRVLMRAATATPREHWLGGDHSNQARQDGAE